MNNPLRIKSDRVSKNPIFMIERLSLASLFSLEKRVLIEEKNSKNSIGFTKILFSLKYVTS